VHHFFPAWSSLIPSTVSLFTHADTHARTRDTHTLAQRARTHARTHSCARDPHTHTYTYTRTHTRTRDTRAHARSLARVSHNARTRAPPRCPLRRHPRRPNTCSMTVHAHVHVHSMYTACTCTCTCAFIMCVLTYVFHGTSTVITIINLLRYDNYDV